MNISCFGAFFEKGATATRKRGVQRRFEGVEGETLDEARESAQRKVGIGKDVDGVGLFSHAHSDAPKPFFRDKDVAEAPVEFGDFGLDGETTNFQSPGQLLTFQ